MIKLSLLYLILVWSTLTASDLNIIINSSSNSSGILYICLVDNETDFNIIKQKSILVNQISKHAVHTISHPLNHESVITFNIKNFYILVFF